MEPLLDRLDGHVAIVSGANRGLGAETALELVGLGARVFAGTRDMGALAGVEGASEGRISPVHLDVLDEASIEAAVAHAVSKAGRLDILVNNAGIGDWHGQALHTEPAERMDRVLATNLRGPMLLAKHALPHLLQATGPDAGPDGGPSAARIVNVSSGMGQHHGMGGSAPAYRISKAGLNGLTTYLHGEYGMRGLISNSICPGWVRTDMGGANAPRSIAEGAAGIVWACRLAPGASSGRFWRDRHLLEW